MTTDDQHADEKYLLTHGLSQYQADAWRARHPWGRSSRVELDTYVALVRDERQ